MQHPLDYPKGRSVSVDGEEYVEVWISLEGIIEHVGTEGHTYNLAWNRILRDRSVVLFVRKTDVDFFVKKQRELHHIADQARNAHFNLKRAVGDELCDASEARAKWGEKR
jgi:hypothetical protein